MGQLVNKTKNSNFSRKASSKGFPRKKKFLGQHFLKNMAPIESMVQKIEIDNQTSVLEIGCGDGALTRQILEKTRCKKLLCYEIDSEWAEHVKGKIIDPRLEIKNENVLDVDFGKFDGKGDWVIIANLPYQITFPIMFLIQRNKHLFREGVMMVQEEVAQKLVAESGRSYSATTIFFQQHFQIELMGKVDPASFSPPPKVFSRLVFFKTQKNEQIPQEKDFWTFLKMCFSSPRRTLKNNLRLSHYETEKIGSETLKLRAQQIPKNELFQIWQKISPDN